MSKEPISVTFSADGDTLMQEGWLKVYAILLRQIINSDEYKADVIKACERILEDYGKEAA